MISNSARSRKSSQVGRRETQTQHTCGVGDAADIKPAAAQASQQVVDLVERLHRRRRVVDRRRERPNGNVDQQADRILWILQGCALLAEDNRPASTARGSSFFWAAVDVGDRQAIGHKIADGIFDLDQGVRPCGQPLDQTVRHRAQRRPRRPVVDDLLSAASAAFGRSSGSLTATMRSAGAYMAPRSPGGRCRPPCRAHW